MLTFINATALLCLDPGFDVFFYLAAVWHNVKLGLVREVWKTAFVWSMCGHIAHTLLWHIFCLPASVWKVVYADCAYYTHLAPGQCGGSVVSTVISQKGVCYFDSLWFPGVCVASAWRQIIQSDKSLRIALEYEFVSEWFSDLVPCNDVLSYSAFLSSTSYLISDCVMS